MWIVAIGWMYVVTLMAATEPSVVGGIMTFFGYGVLPLSIVFYLAGARPRRRRQAAQGLRTDAGAAALPPAGPVIEGEDGAQAPGDGGGAGR